MTSKLGRFVSCPSVVCAGIPPRLFEQSLRAYQTERLNLHPERSHQLVTRMRVL